MSILYKDIQDDEVNSFFCLDAKFHHSVSHMMLYVFVLIVLL